MMEINGISVYKCIEITDISGKTLLKHTVESKTAKIDVSLLSNGIYLIKVKTDNQNLTKLVVISK